MGGLEKYILKKHAPNISAFAKIEGAEEAYFRFTFEPIEFSVQPFAGMGNFKRFRSIEMGNAHPELSPASLSREKWDQRKATFAEIHIDGNGHWSEQKLTENNNALAVTTALVAEVRQGLIKLAHEIESGKHYSLQNCKYIVGYSRLASSTKISQLLGFELFDCEDSDGEETVSHSLAIKNYEHKGFTPLAAKERASKRKAKLALMTRETLLKMYGSKSYGQKMVA